MHALASNRKKTAVRVVPESAVLSFSEAHVGETEIEDHSRDDAIVELVLDLGEEVVGPREVVDGLALAPEPLLGFSQLEVELEPREIGSVVRKPEAGARSSRACRSLSQ